MHKLPSGKMSETEPECAANLPRPPAHARFNKSRSGNARGRSVKNLSALRNENGLALAFFGDQP
jgi:hypothetical protein